jgi:hypothetical protein
MDNTQTQPIPHLSIMNDEQKALYEAYDPSVDISAAQTDNTFDITQRKDIDKTVNSHQAYSVRKYQPPGADDTTEKGSEDGEKQFDFLDKRGDLGAIADFEQAMASRDEIQEVRASSKRKTEGRRSHVPLLIDNPESA